MLEKLKKYVLRWERNLVLESESGKEEHWLVVVELGNILEKVLIDFGKLFQSTEAVWLNEWLDILREVKSRVEHDDQKNKWSQ